MMDLECRITYHVSRNTNIMKHHLLGFAAFLLFFLNIGSAEAGRVERSKIDQVAQNWYRHYAPESKKQAVITKSIPYKYNGRECFRIVSFDKGGFVLVSANDAVTPVLGYGFDFPVPDSITNEAVKACFNDYARQIDTAFVLNLQRTAFSSEWDAILENRVPKSASNYVSPLLTTAWDQGCYYNDKCPDDAICPCSHVWTGCVATAMAQIMKYWNYPARGIGYKQYYELFKPQYGKLSAFFNESDYQWDRMPNSLNTIDTAISTLMYHCGVAANMLYDPSGSGATINDAQHAFVEYFDFNPGIRLVNVSIGDTLKKELDSLRPVYMRSDNPWSSHAYVCDGYDSTGYFHFNFGWSGMFNGYYTLNNMVYGWNNNQAILIGIKPNNSPLQADFEVSATDSNMFFQFINKSRGRFISANWNFGDGQTSTKINPIHYYNTTGFINVQLIACDSVGCDTIVKTINIFELMFSLKQEVSDSLNTNTYDFSACLIVDINNDDALDILVQGFEFERLGRLTNAGTKILLNDSVSFIRGPEEFFQENGNFNTGDYDCDGDMDLLFSSGLIGGGGFGYKTKLFRNDNGVFTEVQISLPVALGVAKFIDYDNDGKLDISVIANDGLGSRMYLFKNNGRTFIPINNNLPKLVDHGFEWADLDGDGFQDLIVSGWFDNLIGTRVFKNLGDGNFSLVINNLDPSNYYGFCGVVKAIDFNKDDKPDLIISGDDYYQGPRTYVFINRGNWVFEKYVDPEFSETASPSIQIIDINADKKFDLILGSKLFCNQGDSAFYSYPSNIIDSRSLCFDFNKDRKPDIFGWAGTNLIGRIYLNISDSAGQELSPPSGLSSSVLNNVVTLKWDRAKFGTLSAHGISYNIRLGSGLMLADVISPESDLASGFRKKVGNGNASYDTTRTINRLPSGKYYWSVQGIDYSFNGSQFSISDSFTIISKLPPELCSFSKEFFMNTWNYFALNDFRQNFISYEKDTLIKIQFTSLPIHGILYLNNQPVTQNQIIRADSICYISYSCANHTKDTIYWNAFDGNTFALNPQKILVDNLLFKPIQTNISPKLSKFAWGDYDHDGDLDLASNTCIYKNTNGTFQDLGIVLTGSGSVNWGDIDGDGDLDLIVGEKVYKNNGNDQFTCSQTLSPAMKLGAAAFGDVYTRNTLDYFNSGMQTSNGRNLSKIYRNLGQGVYSDSTINLDTLKNSAVAWGDFNNDGEQDIALSGTYGNLYYSQRTNLYRNTTGQLSEILANLPPVDVGTLDWGDFDRDGDLDLLLCGFQGIELVQITKIFKNDHGIFTDIGAEFHGVSEGFAKWIDFDADGYLDIMFCGIRNSGRSLAYLYKNNNGTSFTPISSTGLPNLSSVSCTIADYNNDGLPDFIISGITEQNDTVTCLYRNCYGADTIMVNTPPSVPTNLHSTKTPAGVSLQWNKSLDNSTPQNTLSYNIFVSRHPDSLFVMSPMANLETGFRKVPQPGNTSLDNFWHIDSLQPGRYYWSVQAIDNSFAASPFAAVDSFDIHPPVQLSGHIEYHNAGLTSLDSVKIFLMNGPLHVDSSQSNIAGLYQFGAVFSGTYNLGFTTGKEWNSVNGTDALKIQRHFAGLELITEPVRLQAADVNNSNSINGTDALKVKRRFAGLDTTFARGDWTFAKPIIGGDSIVISGTNITQDFYGLCVGDVNGSYVPPSGMKSSSGVSMYYSDTIFVQPDQEFELPVWVDKDLALSAVSMVIELPAENIQVLDVRMNDGTVIYHMKGNSLRMAWSEIQPLELSQGGELLRIRMKVIRSQSENEIIQARITNECELADVNAQVLQGVTLKTKTIKLLASSYPASEASNSTLTILPNPNSGQFRVQVARMLSGVFDLILIDSKGAQIEALTNIQIKKGISDALDLKGLSPGVYFLKLKNETTEFTGKIIFE